MESLRLTLLLTFTFLVGALQAQTINQAEDWSPDSVQLKQDSIYICNNHFFEWCTKESFCAHCLEKLEKVSLWAYYQKLECEDCKEYFFQNYLKFKEEFPQ